MTKMKRTRGIDVRGGVKEKSKGHFLMSPHLPSEKSRPDPDCNGKPTKKNFFNCIMNLFLLLKDHRGHLAGSVS